MDKRKATRSKKSNFAGTTFASAFEAQIAEYLSAIGAEWQYEPVRLPWIPKLRLYVPDFFVRLPSGESFYLEAKGYFDPQARVKMSQIRKQYPDLDIRLFFMNEGVKIPPAKVTTYGDWAIKNGFRYYTFDKGMNNCDHTEETDARGLSFVGETDRQSPGKTSRKTSEPRAQLDCNRGGVLGTETRAVQEKAKQRRTSRRSS